MAEIPLTRGLVTIVDDEDAEWLMRWKWQAKVQPHGSYAARCELLEERGASAPVKMRRMHREIIGAPAGILVDHIDGNGLNNTRANLRLADASQNQHNKRIGRNSSTGFKGVCFDKRTNLYRATIRARYKYFNLGFFDTAEAAYAAYLTAAKKLHGDFMRAA